MYYKRGFDSIFNYSSKDVIFLEHFFSTLGKWDKFCQFIMQSITILFSYCNYSVITLKIIFDSILSITVINRVIATFWY